MADRVRFIRSRGLVRLQDPDALASAAREMSTMSEKELNARGQRGREAVFYEFSRETLTDHLVSIL
jgi:hypothetical protein